MEREHEAANSQHPHARPPSVVARWSSWGFILFAGVAIGYGLWALYGSGKPVFKLDVTGELGRTDVPEARIGPIPLAPSLNPMRAILHASHAPVGSTRLGYEVSLEDAAGHVEWEATGSFGSRDDEASIVMTQTSLATFEVPRAGDYFIRIRPSGASMDDLRSGMLELRRGVAIVDARIPWGFGLAALVCLIASLITRRTAPVPDAEEEPEFRRAA
jgi:hypothetical protein